MAILCRPTLKSNLTLLQLGQNLPGNLAQSFKHAGPVDGHGFENRFFLLIQGLAQLIDPHDARQVSLVQLEHVGHLREIVTVLLQIFLQILPEIRD